MLPALPTGRQWISGASPSTSTISKAAVFWPSIRAGLTELTSSTGYASASLRARVRQSSKLPSTCSNVAPWATAWLSLPIAILPSGTRTPHVMPALVGRPDQRGPALPQGDYRRAVQGGQPVGILVDHSAPQVGHLTRLRRAS